MPHPLVEINEKYLNAMQALFETTRALKSTRQVQYETGLDKHRAKDIWEQIEESRRLNRDGLLEG